MTRIIRQSGDALLTIINDILDFSKIEAGKLDIEKIELSLTEVVDGVAELLAARAHEAGLDLVVDIAPEVIDGRLGDPTRIRQILLNLGGNGIKFTEDGGVTITVREPSPGIIRLEITDTGIGLTEEQRGKLFQAFVQADTSTSRRFGGTGLGLSICQRLTELMDGRIGVDSEPGHGSTFWFELPLEAQGDTAPTYPDPLDGLKVSLVGLGETEVRVASGYLGFVGVADVETAETLAVADARTNGGDPHLIIVDLDTVSPTAEDLATLSTTVFLTARRPTIMGLDRALKAKSHGTLSKPLNRRGLWSAAAVALGLEPVAMEGSDVREDLAFSAPDLEAAAAERAVVLVAEDNETNQIVARQLLGRMGIACEIADDGQAALERFDRDRHGLLLTDFNMPRMDGFELTRAIRTSEQEGGLDRLPILALTADALSDTRDKCLEAGMDDVLTKPIDSRHLGECLSRHLPQALALRRPAAAEEEAKEPAAETVTQQPQAKRWDPDIFDAATTIEMFGAFDGEARAFVTSASAVWDERISGIETAMAAGNTTEARDIAHMLKGAALSVGAKRLGRIAGDLQDYIDEGDDMLAGITTELLAPTLTEFRETWKEIDTP